MTNAYCDLLDVKSSLSGDVPNMGASHDQSLVNKILEVSRDIDRKVALARGETDIFSFLADRLYGQQIIYLSAAPAPAEGTFVLAYDGEITVPIVFDADASVVQYSLENLSTVGSGNVSVSGFAGGPWTVDFAGSLTGPRPTITGRATVAPAAGAIVVLPTVQGVSVVPSERIFRSEPALYGNLLVIDDCVEVFDITTYSSGDAGPILTIGADYVPFPLRGTPIYAIKKTSRGDWCTWPTAYGVMARWGRSDTVLPDVREATVIEVIRSHFSALAGNDDRLGMTPFGSVITSKAFTSKFADLVASYGNKLW